MSGIVVEGLDCARLLVSDRQTGDLVFHLRTVGGEDHYFGVSLRDGATMVAQWRSDIAQVAMAIAADEPITGESVTPQRSVN